MHPELIKISRIPSKADIIFLTNGPDSLPKEFFNKDELNYISRQNNREKQDFFSFNHLDHWLFIQVIKKKVILTKGKKR